jgi:hypothetical protein
MIPRPPLTAAREMDSRVRPFQCLLIKCGRLSAFRKPRRNDTSTAINREGQRASDGMQDSEPVVGHRIELSRLDGGLVPTYFALLPGNEISAEDLRVSERRLTYHNGDPVRETDYIIYSILRLPRRDQIRTLKFYDLLDTIDTAALAGDDDSWQRAKSYYRTALGRTAKWSQPSDNPLICWLNRS